MIRFENVSLSYGGAAAVRNLNFTVGRGEFVALVGANGAGKTTVSKLMNGLLKPTAGRVLVDGVPTTSLRTSALAKKIGFLFQNPDRQLCKPTIREEIRFGLALTGAKDAAQRTEAVLDAFGLDGDRDPFSASRGERQRIALASLIAVEPEVLILDEPTTGLDYRECMAMMARVRSLNAAGTTVVMVCHDMELVLDFAHRMLVLCEGALLLGALGGVFDRAAGMLKGLLKLSVFLFVLQLLFVRTGAPLLSLPPLLVTDRGVMTGLRLVLRLIGATMPLALLLSVTQMSDLSGVLVQRLHVPYKYAFTLTTAIRFIPVFANSLSGIMEAQTARGVAFDTKNPFKKLGLILPLCMPLLISSVGRIHDTAAAAEMRGFTLRTRESQSRRYTFNSGDLFAALIAAALVAAGALL